MCPHISILHTLVETFLQPDFGHSGEELENGQGKQAGRQAGKKEGGREGTAFILTIIWILLSEVVLDLWPQLGLEFSLWVGAVIS